MLNVGPQALGNEWLMYAASGLKDLQGQSPGLGPIPKPRTSSKMFVHSWGLEFLPVAEPCPLSEKKCEVCLCALVLDSSKP